jgi:D-sedoheptulose 7-phosphate isomerase
MKDLLELITKADTVFICGNGGSSATAEHMANDLFSRDIKAVCLNSNTSIITMIANDFGYEHIFSKQLQVFGTGNDLLITISCSGTSPNIVEAQKMAEKLLMPVYSFPTFLMDRDYERLEDTHMKLVHQLKKLL